MHKKKIDTYKIDNFSIKTKHLDKLYWAELGITKKDLMDYYAEISTYILPFLKNRPLTLHYFPYGIHRFSFYKRNFDYNVSNDFINTYEYKEKTQEKVMHVPVVNNRAGLVYLASRGCLELHAWAVTYPDFEHPDIAVFDLDISSKTNFSKVVEVANILNDRLLSLKIKSYVKTSGSTGMHVYVPLNPIYSFEKVRNWVKNIGEELSKKYPNLITTIQEQRKSHSGDKVVIDFLQNAITRNTAIPYTPRANVEARISAPLLWDEVRKGNFSPSDFTMKNILKRISKIGNPFKDILNTRQDIFPSII